MLRIRNANPRVAIGEDKLQLAFVQLGVDRYGDAADDPRCEQDLDKGGAVAMNRAMRSPGSASAAIADARFLAFS